MVDFSLVDPLGALAFRPALAPHFVGDESLRSERFM